MIVNILVRTEPEGGKAQLNQAICTFLLIKELWCAIVMPALQNCTRFFSRYIRYLNISIGGSALDN